jgi:electron-transferring-flavoprotein dehydrogenase
VKPADYPAPWDDGEAIAGPAGLAAAIRLGQLAAADEERAAELGEVPVAILEKGKGPGAHLLSGAVLNPEPLRRLLGDEDFPSYGEVPGEAVYFLTKDRAVRVPPPPTMWNKGNVVVSLSQLGRALAEKAEGLGAMVLHETAATQLLVADGAVVGVRTGDKGRGRDGE